MIDGPTHRRMTHFEDAVPAPLDMLETGVPNLDRILGRGLIRGAIAIVIGPPGAGKTVLGQQITFHLAARGEPVLYLTGYSETHTKLLAHSRSLSFFDASLIGKAIQLGSLPDLLREGAEEAQRSVLTTVRRMQARLVVMDGFGGMGRLLSGQNESTGEFLYSLGAQLALLGATTLVLLEGSPDDSAHYSEATVCDVVLGMRRELFGTRHRRLLDVLKVRGAPSLQGSHPFTINADGVQLSPRLESIIELTEPASFAGRASFGVSGLDALLHGGLSIGTSTLAYGGPGTGKTLFGLHFLMQGARLGEPALFIGFKESSAQLHEKATVFGLDLAAAEAAKTLRLITLHRHDLEADRVAAILQADVEARGVRRLVIDSAAQLEHSVSVVDPTRAHGFLGALVSYFRQRGITTYATREINNTGGLDLDFGDTPLAPLAENLLLLRTEHTDRIVRSLAVLRMRFSDHNGTPHEYVIRPGLGIDVLGPAPRA